MKLKTEDSRQTLKRDKAFLKQPVERDDIERFKANLQTLLGKINENESEEHHKNFIRDFLKDTFYNTFAKFEEIVKTASLKTKTLWNLLETIW